jgi:hypothetical protein
VKRTRRDELIEVAIHIFMEARQKSPLSQTRKQKPSCFSSYLLCFFFYKIEEQEGSTGSALEGDVWHQ